MATVRWTINRLIYSWSLPEFLSDLFSSTLSRFCTCPFGKHKNWKIRYCLRFGLAPRGWDNRASSYRVPQCTFSVYIALCCYSRLLIFLDSFLSLVSPFIGLFITYGSNFGRVAHSGFCLLNFNLVSLKRRNLTTDKAVKAQTTTQRARMVTLWNDMITMKSFFYQRKWKQVTVRPKWKMNNSSLHFS